MKKKKRNQAGCYERYKEAHLQSAAKRRKMLKDFVDSTKSEQSCYFCSETEAVCLDFHHLRDKEYNINNMRFRGMAVERIKKEMEKCVVVCSNCHRKLHAELIDFPK